MNIEEQVELLMQGTEYGDEELKKAMANELRQRLLDAQNEGRPLRVYCGFDPTSTDLHLGHTIPMRKLRQFQDLGHDVTFLIGSYTALVGDPSDKNKARPWITQFSGMSLAQVTDKDWKVRKDGGKIDYYAGATVTPRAVTKATLKAAHWVEANRDRLFAEGGAK